MRYDLYYIKHRSLWLDARILLRTILVVLGGEGASRMRRHVLRHPTLAWSGVRPPADDTAFSAGLIGHAQTRPWVKRVGRGAS
jgi:hypothetical protein